MKFLGYFQRAGGAQDAALSSRFFILGRVSVTPSPSGPRLLPRGRKEESSLGRLLRGFKEPSLGEGGWLCPKLGPWMATPSRLCPSPSPLLRGSPARTRCPGPVQLSKCQGPRTPGVREWTCEKMSGRRGGQHSAPLLKTLASKPHTWERLLTGQGEHAAGELRLLIS